MNRNTATSEPTPGTDTLGGVFLAETAPGRHTGRVSVSLPSTLDFAHRIEALAPCLVERFRLCGINPDGADDLARDFTRKVATVFYTLEIQNGALNLCRDLAENVNQDMPVAYTMALHAMLPELVRLCVAGRADNEVWPNLVSDGHMLCGQGRLRLLVLASLVGCLTRIHDPGDRPLSQTENLALTLMAWAKQEMAEHKCL